jgi:dephospho-CoA kinase
MLLVGLTGGIASGKSTVAKLLAERGAAVVDADEIARMVVEPGTEAWSKIVEHFGKKVLLPDQRINRVLLGRIVFDDAAKRALLNEIVHPQVMRVMADRLEELRSTDGVVVCDVPLLVEVGSSEMFDIVVVITSDVETQIERLLAERGMGRGDAEARIKAQAATPEKVAVADYVIANDGDIAGLEAQVSDLWAKLTEQRARN